MGEKLVIGIPYTQGLQTDKLAFNIDNNSFATFVNAYQWRGRIKRKRGTSFLTRLARQIVSLPLGTSAASPWTFNLFSFLSPSISTSEPNASIDPGTVKIFFTPSTTTGNIVTPGYTIASDCEVTTNTTTGLATGSFVTISGVNANTPNLINGGPYKIELIDATHFKLGLSSETWGTWASGGTWSTASGTIIFIDQGDGTLTSTTGGNSGTINYVTGAVTLTHTGGVGVAVTASFEYFPDLPAMGLPDLILIPTQFPGKLGFDTKYAYNIDVTAPYDAEDVSYYKNPATGTYTNYVKKSTATPLTWNGLTYQQFWSVNYENALWTTNGIRIPFNQTNVGMQYKPIITTTVTAGGPPATVSLQITAHGLVVGDFVFINEVVTTTGINMQTGYVTTVTDANNVIVTFPNATIATNGTGGIAQYLTNRSDTTKDCIRWYDGDPDEGYGWVNFCPPLSNAPVSIANLPLNNYYLVTARMIVPFKDRLLFLGAVVGNSSGSIFYLQDTVIYSQNGTPYYTASFTGNVLLPTTTFNQILVPDNQTAIPASWFSQPTGFGGFISAGTQQPIVTAGTNEDVIIIGFSAAKARFTYTGNDIIPFNFFIINDELGDASVFSLINMDKGVMTRGTRGYIISSQVEVQRFDLNIPDQVFQINLRDNGNERFTAIRDFINEWVYFTYKSNDLAQNNTAIYPNQTLLYNYRDNSWAVFNESFTTYGNFRRQTGLTWNKLPYKTWSEWNDPWNAGTSTLFQQEVIGGNQQGFILFRDEGTSESKSLYIKAFSGVSNIVTSPNHNLSNEDWIVISGVLGTAGSSVNGKIFSVFNVTVDTFQLSPDPVMGAATYLGGGVMKLAYVPLIQSKQFPTSWQYARKTRIGVQQYLITRTALAQITLLIFLSQDASYPYNFSPSVLNPGLLNNSLIFSQALFTCPESTNLGLTAWNINLQELNEVSSDGTCTNAQAQIWHRMNTSLIGDTVQLGFTLSDEQMRDQTANNAYEEIEIHGMILDVSPSQMLS